MSLWDVSHERMALNEFQYKEIVTDSIVAVVLDAVRGGGRLHKHRFGHILLVCL